MPLRDLAYLTLLLLLCASPARAETPACGGDGALPPGCGNIVFDGDSISAGAGATAAQHPDVLFLKALDRPSRLANVAVSGRPVGDCLSLFPIAVAPKFLSGVRFNLIVFHAGDNDIARGSDDAAAYAAFTAYVAAAHRQGWTVIVSTELPHPDFSPTREQYLDDYNRRLLANQAGADAVVDLSQVPRLNDVAAREASGWYAPDHVHLNGDGYAVLARLLAGAARKLLAP